MPDDEDAAQPGRSGLGDDATVVPGAPGPRSVPAAGDEPTVLPGATRTGAGAGGVGGAAHAVGEAVGAVGGRVGRYALKGLLGEGGMGSVYLAEQSSPRREVALKVVRASVMTPRLRRRFEVETEVLGRLEHPNIARVYEAGHTDAGEPFFAMEVVRGFRIDAFARDRGLMPRGRAALFLQVCEAVRHAHQRGVIHRDLKPANIMVTAGAGDAVVKVLDFGVARATDSDAQATVQTHTGAVVGTVPYMSPEQISGDTGDLDARSDVYSLGVVLHELLTGSLPHDVTRKTLVEAARLITMTEPARLSLHDASLRGDLEVIVGKALEKDRQRRYQSAEALGDDLRRWLANKPIEARPATAAYRFCKFASRHKGLVGAAGVAVAVLLAGTAATTVGFVSATREAGRANRALALLEEENAANLALNEFLIDRTLLAVTPEEALGEAVTAAEVFDAAAGAVDDAFADQPALRARTRATIGRAQFAIGEIVRAERTLRRAVGELEAQGKGAGADSVRALQALMASVFRQGRYEEAGALSAKLSGVLSASALPERERFVASLEAASTAAACLNNLGDPAGAAEALRAAIDSALPVLGADDPQVQTLTTNLAYSLEDLGRADEALLLYQRVADARRAGLGEDHPRTLVALNNLASCLWGLGRQAEAAEQANAVYEASVRVRGEEHPDTNLVRSNLAFMREATGDLASAEALHRAALAVAQRGGTGETVDAAIIRDNLAMCLHRQGEHDEAFALQDEALAVMERLAGAGAPASLNTRFNIARGKTMAGSADAAAYWGDLCERLDAELGEQHGMSVRGVLLHAEALRAAGLPAGERAQEAMRRLGALVGTEHPLYAQASAIADGGG